MKKGAPLLYVSLLILVFLIPVSLCLGRYPVSIAELFQTMRSPAENIRQASVLFDIRLPRIIAACITGAALSLAGTVFQSVFHNPMATPDLLGTSSGSCFGAALGMLLGLSRQNIIFCSFLFGILSVLLVMLLTARFRKGRLVSLILVGIVTGSLFTAGTSCVKLLADQDNRLPSITYWMMGSLSAVNMPEVFRACALTVPSALLLLLLRYRLNSLLLSEEEAHSIGINIRFLRAVAIFCATLLTASSVSLSGLIGWIGLMIPNLCRKIAGSDCRRLIPLSILFGAIFLLLMDNLARTLLTVEIPIGILTALIGAPVFLITFLKRGDSF